MSALPPSGLLERGASRVRRNDFRMIFVADRVAKAFAADLKMRPDMRAQFEAGGGVIPPGPKWALTGPSGLLGLGGFEATGAGASLGWYLTADLRSREWAAARWATRTALDWARGRAIRRIHALTPGDLPAAARMLARLGFKLTGQEGDDAVMTLEMEKR